MKSLGDVTLGRCTGVALCPVDVDVCSIGTLVGGACRNRTGVALGLVGVDEPGGVRGGVPGGMFDLDEAAAVSRNFFMNGLLSPVVIFV